MTTHGKNLYPTTASPTNLQKIFELLGLPIAVIIWQSQIAHGDELFQLTPLACWTYASINSKLQRPPQSFELLKISALGAKIEFKFPAPNCRVFVRVKKATVTLLWTLFFLLVEANFLPCNLLHIEEMKHVYTAGNTRKFRFKFPTPHGQGSNYLPLGHRRQP